MTYIGPTLQGHPREPETFSFTETTYGARGEIRRVVRSYVAFDSRWPWWRRLAVSMASRVVRGVK